MIEPAHASANLLLAYSAYAIGTASPGPSNLAIMAIAMDSGRKAALVFALGVVSGSVFWGLLAALGLSAIFSTYASAILVMKILGGVYLLWLAAKSARAAFSAQTGPAVAQTPASDASARTCFRGAAMHLTNPKAIFVWLSIVSLAMPTQPQTSDALLVVAGCTLIGTAVFCGYALVFSTPIARRAYRASRRWFEGALALMFGYAGIRMLMSRA